MKWNIGTKIGGGYFLALTALVVIGVVSYRNTATLIETTSSVSHTHEILEGLEQIISVVKDAETGQRGFLLTGEDRYLEPYNSARKALDQVLSRMGRLTEGEAGDQEKLSELKSLIDAKMSELQETIDLRRDPAKGFEAAKAVVLTDRGQNVMDQIRKTVTQMQEHEMHLLKAGLDNATQNAALTRGTVVWGTLAALVILMGAGLWITRNIAMPLNQITGVAQKIASGDLRVTVPLDGRGDEVGMLSRTFVTMVDRLRKNTGELAEGVNVLAASASEILAATTQVASGAAETGTAIAQTTTTVEEVKQTAQNSSQKAKSVSETAQKVMQVGHAGRKSVEASIDGMNRIQGQMESIAESVVRLTEQSQAIGEIIATVNDLAEQSNLLAVNAAIEAAKAGEHGKGFSVVAQEVRNLANQSKQATAQVRVILNEIQKATTAAVMATEQGSKAVEAGVKQSAEAGESIRQLAEGVTAAAQAATQIAASSQQQMAGTDQVALAMENIKQASSQNVAGTRQAESAAHNLHELGLKLKLLVEQYQV